MTTSPDFGRTTADYGRHRQGLPASVLERAFDEGLVRPADRVLELGAGTGLLARALAARGCRVVALDRSGDMLDTLRSLARDAGIDVACCNARAEHVGLADGTFDLVCAVQCWHWFDQRAASREVSRVLRPDGRLLLVQYDWLPLPGSVVEATESLILQHNPTWSLGGGNGLYPHWADALHTAGFRDVTTRREDVPAHYTPEAWRGRIRASAGIGAALPHERVAAFDAAHAALLRERFSGELLEIPHRIYAITARPPRQLAPDDSGGETAEP